MIAKKTSSTLESVSMQLQKILDPISTYLVYIGALLSLVMAVIVLIDIILRQIFNSPLVGMIELETFMLAVLCFFSLAYTMIQNGHVSVDILAERLSSKPRALLKVLFPLLSSFVFGIISWQYALHTKQAWQLNELSDVLSWPMWPFFAVTCFGCALLFFWF